MMTALATVLSVKSLSSGFDVELSCEQKTSCGTCSSQKSCGTGIMSKALASKALHWNLKTSTEVRAGQIVEIGLPEKNLLASAALVYLVPIFCMFVGAILSQWFIAPILLLGESVIIIASLFCGALGIFMARQLLSRIEKHTSKKVILLRVLGDPIS